MNGLTKSKAAGYLLVVFLLGAVAGGAGGFAVGRQRDFHPPPPRGDMAQRLVSELTHELKLTTEQVALLEPIAAQASTQMNTLRSNTWNQAQELKAQNDERIEAFLSPEQKELFRVCRERFGKGGFDKGRDRRGDGSRPDGPPPDPPKN